MIFDAHGDIWTDITIKREQGEKDIFKKYHLKKYKRGEVTGGIFVIWCDPPYDKTPKERIFQVIKNISNEILENQDLFKVIRKYEDLEAVKNNKFTVMIGIEGLSGIGKDIDMLNQLYMFGARHGSLTWNEQNELGTGVLGDENRGLTQYGVKAVKKMNDLGMIVDVSHANEKTFWDIYEVSDAPIIASHSNCRALCDVPRNLTDAQIKAIGEKGGVMGLNAFREFVSLDKEKQTLDSLVDHVDHIVELVGIDHVCFGFDFFDYLQGDTVDSFSEDNSIGIPNFQNISKVQNLIKALEDRGYSKEDLEKIKYKNIYRIIKEVLK
ncbi:dipeptidase [Clostridiisalibacter paucivorans]|uniref:dipeptidase n=1 Tax=Clostridiisalibacter paucivorans TaxID=408753 RepID=UPI00047E35F3|nr:dipeptidase [Clostridiisalibacter paucivorans]